MRSLIVYLAIIFIFSACSSNEIKKQTGVPLNQPTPNNDGAAVGNNNIKEVRTRPTDVLLTGHPNHRLVTVYKINYDSRRERYYTGSNHFHRTYPQGYYEDSDSRYNHYMPGIEAVYGYNMLNVSHYDFSTKERKGLFENPVLINTLYYPSLRQDTLHDIPVSRNYYMVSVYDKDTNKDSVINRIDLRRFYYFDLNAVEKTTLIPLNYSVMSSEYDAENDVMFIFAKLDENSNGIREEDEPVHVFWIDLKSPKMAERLY